MALKNARLHDQLKRLDDERNINGQTPQMQEIFG